MAAPIPGLDPTTFKADITRAQLSGRPVAVYDNGGALVGHVDPDGSLTGVDGKAIAVPQPAPRQSTPSPPAPETPGPYVPMPGNPELSWNPATGEVVTVNSLGMVSRVGQTQPASPMSPQRAKETQRQQQAQQQQQTDSAAGLAVDTWNAAHPVWVNGQRMVATAINPDGSMVFKYQGTAEDANTKAGAPPPQQVDRSTGKAIGAGQPTAYGALDMPQNYGILAGISGGDQFTMSTGPVDVFSGMSPFDQGAVITGKGDASPAYRPATGDHSWAANTVPNGASKYTIAQGLDWFANLSHSNQPAYNELVNMLKHAGYYGQNPGDTQAGPYGEQAGLAFVKMAKDLSVYQQTTGDQMGMADYLAQKQQATRDQAAAQTQKVFRDYADQGSLMSAARSAAQNVLGRNLTPAELQAFESSYRGQEDSYYNSEDAAAVAQAQAKATGESAPTFSGSRPDASGQADALVQGPQFTQDRYNYGAQNMVQTLMSMFGVK